jgi:hypothetical protein
MRNNKHSLVLAAWNMKQFLRLVWREVMVRVDHFHQLPIQVIAKLKDVPLFKVTVTKKADNTTTNRTLDVSEMQLSS